MPPFKHVFVLQKLPKGTGSAGETVGVLVGEEVGVLVDEYVGTGVLHWSVPFTHAALRTGFAAIPKSCK